MKKVKLPQNKNLLIVAVLVAVIAAVLIVSLTMKHSPAVTPDAQQIEIAQADKAPDPADPAEPAGEPAVDGASAAAYVLCSLPSSGQYGLIPLPAEGEVSYPIRQTFADGTETENVLHLTPEGFSMESSTCKNQDCVGQGEVTLENREERVLQNCVICLPNQVMAELYTAEEIAEMNLPAPEDGGQAED